MKQDVIKTQIQAVLEEQYKKLSAILNANSVDQFAQYKLTPKTDVSKDSPKTQTLIPKLRMLPQLPNKMGEIDFIWPTDTDLKKIMKGQELKLEKLEVWQ